MDDSPHNGSHIFPNKNEFEELSDAASHDSEKTIFSLDEQKILKDINKNYLEEQLAKYPLEERKYLIIDRNNSMIIDTREEDAMKLFIKKSSEATKSSNANNFLSIDDNTLNQ